jgi:hypothetical protein
MLEMNWSVKNCRFANIELPNNKFFQQTNWDENFRGGENALTG